MLLFAGGYGARESAEVINRKPKMVRLAVVLFLISSAAGFGVQPRQASSSFGIAHTCTHPDGVRENAASSFQQSIESAVKKFLNTGRKAVTVALVASTLATACPALAADMGASSVSNTKLTTGGASTLQSGRTISITRGVNLDNADFHGQNLKGVAFQQSIVRDADLSNTNLVGASFFDATLDGTNFENADMTLANVEMAQFNRANLKNAVMKEVYVSGATLFEGVKSIENTDWTDTFLRADQKKYLCNHPTAKGTNPKTGVDTRESLMCLD